MIANHVFKSLCLWLILAFGVLQTTGGAEVEDWPTYCHDNRRSGITHESLTLPLVEQWSYQSPMLPQTAWAGPAKWDAYAEIERLKSMRNFDPAFYTVVVDGQVLFGSSVDDAVHCLDVETGSERWVAFTNGPVRVAPTVDHNQVYFGSDDGYVYAVALHSGEVCWRRHPASQQRTFPSNGKLISNWPCRTGALVEDGIVYGVASLFPWESSYVFALSAQDGSSQGAGLFIRSKDNLTAQGPLLASSDYLYVSQGRQAPILLQRRNGAVLSSLGSSGFGGIFGLLAEDETLVHGHGQNHGSDGELRVFAAQQSDVLLTYPKATTILINGDQVYLHAEDQLQAFDRIGYSTLQVRKAELNKQIKACQKELKKLAQQDANSIRLAGLKSQIKSAREGLREVDAEVASCFYWQVDSDCPLSLIMAGETLFAGGNGCVAAYDSQSGEELWRMNVSGRAYGLTVSHGKLLVSTDLGQILCLGAATSIRARSTRTVSIVTSLSHAHAHNDYRHDRPLLDALDHGFVGVEADIYLQDGQLLVAHDRHELTPERTLDGLYLQPLYQRVTQQGGQVYADGKGIMLLVDIKDEGEAVYAVLDELLSGYASMLTRRIDGVVTSGPVTVVISGDRPWETIASDTTRYVGLDGRLKNLDSPLSTDLLPLISDRWSSYFTWKGQGDMPEDERAKLHDIVTQAHAQGRWVRFWATPDAPGSQREAVWQVLLAEGIEFLNTDDLDGLRNFLQERDH